MLDLSKATLACFAPHVGTRFALDHPDHEEAFVLVQADQLAINPDVRQRREPFALFFDGSRTDIQYDQQVVPLKHAAMGKLGVFLVPIARNADGTVRYQAVFN